MSNRELDHLFKSKLEELEKQPSARAWNEIQASVNTRNKRGGWFYSGIAAAIVALVTVGSILWVNRDTEQPVEQIAGKTEVGSQKSEVRSRESEDRSGESEVEAQRNTSLVKKEPLLALNNASSNTNKETANSKSQTSNPELRSKNNKLQTGNTKLETVNSELQTVNSELRTQNSEPENRELRTKDSEPRTEDSEMRTVNTDGQTLIFNIEDFNTSKVTATMDDADETEKDKKPSTLRKVIDFAKNVKEGDAGLGELREAKNELLALNFKKDDDSK